MTDEEELSQRRVKLPKRLNATSFGMGSFEDLTAAS
jgi:hypothetical protein